jgi:NNP family nitrate/nitrite transporter-like MFS transporter
MFFGSLLMALSGSLTLSFIAVLLLAVGMGTTQAAVFKLVPREIPHAVGGASGWVGGIGAFGGFVFPNLLVTFVKTAEIGDMGYARGFSVFAGFALISLALVILIRLRSKTPRTV